jgi:hypothetical protein
MTLRWIALLALAAVLSGCAAGVIDNCPDGLAPLPANYGGPSSPTSHGALGANSAP